MSSCGYKYMELGQLKLCTRTVRNSFCLPRAEQVVLLFILDRTVGWNKVEEKISTSQFVNGVIRRKRGHDILMAGGTRLTVDEVNEALTRLKERGAIETTSCEGKVAYSVNEDWCHPDLRELGMWELNESDYDYEHEDDASCG